jgi:purine-nucleoside phosphorylase
MVAAVGDFLGGERPAAAIILGSGLAGVADRMADARRIDWSSLPGFASPGVAGHPGALVVGRLGGRTVLAQQGRRHGYEGGDPGTVAAPIRAYARLGISILLATNAAGAIRRSLQAGGLMMLADHLNLSFRSPLAGPVRPGEARFPDLSEPYDRALRALARRAALELAIALDEGVYAGVGGPSYETPAEIRVLERVGADAVGMSTVPEVIVARAGGMRCWGLSVITNPAAGHSTRGLSHDDVTAVSARATDRVARLLEGVIARL